MPVPEPSLHRVMPPLLAEPAPPEIIDPPQYSIAWLILAVLCLLVITALVLGTLRITRAIEKRLAYRRRPDEVESLKAEFLRAVNDIADRHEAGEVDARSGHHELTAVMRRFVRRTTGHDVTSQDLSTLLADPRTPATTATRDGADLVITGEKALVPCADSAGLFVVSVMLDGAARLVIIEAGLEGLTTSDEPAMGIRAAHTGRLHLDGVRVPAENLLGKADATLDAIRRSRLAWAALACGTGRAVLDQVRQYVVERKAFGEPIGHRQAVAFTVSNIAIELDGLRLVTYRGAARADQGLAFNREAALARKLATDKGMRIGLDGVQLLGGHGYIKEHPVERWYRDLRGVGVAEGVVLL